MSKEQKYYDADKQKLNCRFGFNTLLNAVAKYSHFIAFTVAKRLSHEIICSIREHLRPFMSSIFVIHFNDIQKRFDIPLRTWLFVFTFWLVVAMVTSLHCFFYDKWVGSQSVSALQSLTWAAIRWLGWSTITSVIIRFAYRITTSRNLIANMSQFFLISIGYSIAPAVLNSIFASSGKRFRSLPISYTISA